MINIFCKHLILFYITVKARREEQIKTAHDEAMFGSSRTVSVEEQEPNVENENKSVENIPVASLVSEKVRTYDNSPSFHLRCFLSY